MTSRRRKSHQEKTKKKKKKAEKKLLRQIKNTKKKKPPSKTGSASPQRVPLQYDTVIQFLVWLSVGGRGGEEAVTHAGSSPLCRLKYRPLAGVLLLLPPARACATGRERISATQSSSLYGGGRLICGLWSGRLLPPPPSPHLQITSGP